jgi:hypothetical protein
MEFLNEIMLLIQFLIIAVSLSMIGILILIIQNIKTSNRIYNYLKLMNFYKEKQEDSKQEIITINENVKDIKKEVQALKRAII